MGIEGPQVEIEKPPTWDEIVTTNVEQRKLHKINPLLNARLIVGKKFPIAAQFILELLQNADDAEAKNVILSFENGEFTCEHDGVKIFQESDAIGISRIGFTGKEESENSIGRFGLGFKSVFQYTDSVRIHSGRFNFSLFDYFWINNDIPRPQVRALGETSTVFIFTVSKEIIDLEKASRDIMAGLRELNHRSLIFLGNIESLEIRIDGKVSKIRKSPKNNDIVQITIEDSGSTRSSVWLRKLQTISLPVFIDSPFLTKKGTFGITIQLDGEEFKSHKIVPIPADKGIVFSYFPLNLENSGLKFFIHAPFFVEDNRIQFSLNPDSKPGNDELLSELGKLTNTVLVELLNLGADADSIVSLIPLASEIPEKYKTFFNVLIAELTNARIIKSEKGSWEHAGKFVNLSENLRGIFHDHDLALIARCFDTFENRPVRQANEVPIGFQPEYLSERSLRVLQQVGMHEVSNRVGKRIFELFAMAFNAEVIDSRQARPTVEQIMGWLERCDTQDLSKLYKFIHSEFNSNEILTKLPIFRVGPDKNHSFRFSDQVYMARSRDNSGDDILDPLIFNIDDQTANIEMKNLGIALRRFGLTIKDKWEILKRDYKDSRKRIFNENLEKKEFLRLLEFYREDKLRLLQIVDKNFTIFCVNEASQLVLKKASDSFMRNEENSNLLMQLFEVSQNQDDNLPIWDGYHCAPDADDLLDALGVHNKLFIFDSGPKGYLISFLSEILESKNIFFVRELWNFLLTLEKREIFNIGTLGRSEFPLQETALCRVLKNSDWIPCQDGTFKKPYNCDKDSIDLSLIYFECLALEKLEFGGATKDELRHSEAEQAKAKAVGLDSIEEIEDYKKFKEIFGEDYVKQALADYESRQFETTRSVDRNSGAHSKDRDFEASHGELRNSGRSESNFEASAPRYANEAGQDFVGEGDSNPRSRKNEITKTSEIYADSHVTEQGKKKNARLMEIEAKSRILIERANSSLGRKLVPMHGQNEGYDFEFYENGQKKYIEAKGTVSKWDAAGVRLSPREIEYANNYGANYEIWIVEELETDSPKIWRIVDFPMKVGGFRLNESWIPQAMLFGFDFGHASGN